MERCTGRFTYASLEKSLPTSYSSSSITETQNNQIFGHREINMETICIISARNLGDAAMHAHLLKQIETCAPQLNIVIWTFPQAAFLFKDLANIEIILSDFPMGASLTDFFKGGWRSFFSAAKKIRAKSPTTAIDLIGDIRERIALKLIGATKLYYPVWGDNHPFRKHIRTLNIHCNQYVQVPDSAINIYHAQKIVIEATRLHLNASALPIGLKNNQNAFNFGLHPSASLPFKLWPSENWAALINLLHSKYPDSSFTIFGSPSEREALELFSGKINHPHKIFTSTLSEFKACLNNIDFLIGLDSFSVHLAHSVGLPSIVLVGANNPQVFTPPSAVSITHPGRCRDQPCGGKPTCIGSNHQYSCMLDITPEEVLIAIEKQLHNSIRNLSDKSHP